jgi:hypothetical protein
VVVDDLDVVRIAGPPSETDPPLPVDTDAVLTGAIAVEFLEAIRRRNLEIMERRRSVKHAEFAKGRALDICAEPLHPLAPEQPFRVPILEPLDHGPIITLGVIIVKRY